MAAVFNLGIALFCVFSGIFSCSFAKRPQYANESCIDYVSDYCLIWLKYGHLHRSTGSRFTIFCHNATSKSIIYTWRSIYLQFENVPEDYKLFDGDNHTDVYTKYKSETIWYPISWVSWRDTYVDFPAFSSYCLGVDANEAFAAQLVVRSVNYWKILQTTVGVILFICSPSLSRNVVFHYASGVSAGVIASVLIVLFVLTRFIPRKSASYAFLVFGSSLMIYLAQQFYNKLPDILANYMGILLAYIFFSAFISFFLCYRFGPVQNVRTIHIIQWSMQGIALLVIFFSTEYREVSTVLIIFLLSYYFLPLRVERKIKAIWYRYFPPKLKLLTETEYIEQGNRETKKALEELRKYCSSPDCKAWTTVIKLKDPKRFASFVEGDSHLTDEEMLLYDSETPSYEEDTFLTDDENEQTHGFSNHINSNCSSL